MAGALLGADRADAAKVEGERVGTLTTRTGQVYHECEVARVAPDGVTFRHANGVAKVLFADLDETWRQRLGYDPKKAEAYAQAWREKYDAQRRRDAAAQLAVEQVRQRALEARERLERDRQNARWQALQIAEGGLDHGGGIQVLPPIQGPAMGGRSFTHGSQTLAWWPGYWGGSCSLSGWWMGRSGWGSLGGVWVSPTLGTYRWGGVSGWGFGAPVGGGGCSSVLPVASRAGSVALPLLPGAGCLRR